MINMRVQDHSDDDLCVPFSYPASRFMSLMTWNLQLRLWLERFRAYNPRTRTGTRTPAPIPREIVRPPFPRIPLPTVPPATSPTFKTSKTSRLTPHLHARPFSALQRTHSLSSIFYSRTPHTHTHHLDLSTPITHINYPIPPGYSVCLSVLSAPVVLLSIALLAAFHFPLPFLFPFLILLLVLLCPVPKFLGPISECISYSSVIPLFRT